MYFKIEYIKNGKMQDIVISAKSVKDAIKKFREKKLGVIINIEEFKKPSLFEEIVKKLDLAKVELEEYIAVLEQMYVMLDAGLAIDMVVGNIKDTIKNKRLRQIFYSLENDIKAGLSLTSAFEKFEKELGKLTVSMIKLGEETGDLASAIKDLSVILHEILDNRKRLKKATRYPMFIVFAMSIAFVIVILFVIPPFKSIFAQLNTELPLPTRFLLWIEASIQEYGLYILLGAFVIFGLITYMYNTNENVRLKMDKLLLKIYIVGPVIKLAMTGRFVYVLQRLIDSGIPILDAVDIALNIIDNTYMKKQFEHIRTAIVTGGTIKQGFEESGMFENMSVQMIAAGEESGSLVLMLQKVSNYYLEKYRYIVDNIAVLIEPILIAAIAGFVMTLALGIFLPMWNLTEAIK
ncbi:msha biogenesis protein mshg [Nautilia profundicola AmH]|uniref:Msha biogenesis protein mshg n=1 Tax=Nautilia profundicola (strain ATCC BAA-1463 / DSM 18972 / AmH) TaxID=598659 RepID=B9L5X4_NAUPA|nr:type II secretion system F family protein [Nautilia profundicola]ACM93121.1 msha biogenesis protein mshg [Nautilia profundicola AmH]